MGQRIFTPNQKAAVALAALQGDKTLAEISSIYQVHDTQIRKWKKQAEEGLAELFSDKRHKENKTQERLIEELYKTIGQREVELNWLKKKLSPFTTQGESIID
jgi:transposase-like protein